jgi:rhodanese-related sulfurtransferase
MIQQLKNILGLAPKVDYKTLIQNGAQIIDVRTHTEFKDGHIKGSVNIPLHQLNSDLSKIKRDRPIITCCASGMRSASAKSLLKAKGFAEVYNGGGWASLKNKIS